MRRTTYSVSEIRYATVWEDADILCEALAPVATGERLLSIASAGDNVLALLTLNPREVVAVDNNPAQLACLALRIAAFRYLDHESLLNFLGAGDSSTSASPGRPASPSAGIHRLTAYAALRSELPDTGRSFWDAHPELIRRGILHAGRFERYLATFRRWVLPCIHPRRTVEALLRRREPAAREQFYRTVWDTPRWRLLFRLFFSRGVMARTGRSPAHFRHAPGAVALPLLARTRRALTELDPSTNPYLGFILNGAYPRHALPRCLRPEHHAAIRTRLDRVTLHSGDITTARGTFRGFNLSDLFEYLSPEAHAHTYAALAAQALPGARLVYWNLLADRACPPSLRPLIRPLTEIAVALHRRDRAWFYGALQVDERMRPADHIDLPPDIAGASEHR